VENVHKKAQIQPITALCWDSTRDCTAVYVTAEESLPVLDPPVYIEERWVRAATVLSLALIYRAIIREMLICCLSHFDCRELATFIYCRSLAS